MGPLEVRCESDLAGLLTSSNQFARRDTNEDTDVYIERHGFDGLAVAIEYADEYVDGTLTHCIAARELDLSPLEAEIIFDALESVANAYADTAA